MAESIIRDALLANVLYDRFINAIDMKVILENSTAEVVEKKSRFIADLFYVADVSSAEEKLNAIRKLHYSAKHHCYAYILGEKGDNVKSSDDGEPQGTAGHPMLDILKGNELTNCIAIVTRYFGGTLLGTGGLVRAYSDSLKSAIAKAKISTLQTAYKIDFEIAYDDYGKVENLVQNINQFSSNDSSANDNNESTSKNIFSLAKTFENVVKLEYLVNVDFFDKFRAEIINITRGKVTIKDDKKVVYYLDKNDIRYL